MSGRFLATGWFRENFLGFYLLHVCSLCIVPDVTSDTITHTLYVTRASAESSKTNVWCRPGFLHLRSEQMFLFIALVVFWKYIEANIRYTPIAHDSWSWLYDQISGQYLERFIQRSGHGFCHYCPVPLVALPLCFSWLGVCTVHVWPTGCFVAASK